MTTDTAKPPWAASGPSEGSTLVMTLVPGRSEPWNR
jgi:hypothetical protein